jgi:hypothetical protein
MKYKTKIVPHQGNYIGYVMLDNNVVFSSNPHRDTVMVAREMSNYIASAVQPFSAPVAPERQTVTNPPPSTDNLVPLLRTSSTPPVNLGYVPPAAPVQQPRRCCGR